MIWNPGNPNESPLYYYWRKMSGTPYRYPMASRWWNKKTTDEKKEWTAYELMILGSFVPGAAVLGYYLLSTIKPDGIGGFRASMTYGFGQVNNALYESTFTVETPPACSSTSGCIEFDEDDGPGLYSLVGEHGLPPGTYYVRVAGYSASYTGTYRLTIWVR